MRGNGTGSSIKSKVLVTPNQHNHRHLTIHRRVCIAAHLRHNHLRQFHLSLTCYFLRLLSGHGVQWSFCAIILFYSLSQVASRHRTLLQSVRTYNEHRVEWSIKCIVYMKLQSAKKQSSYSTSLAMIALHLLFPFLWLNCIMLHTLTQLERMQSKRA